MDIVKSNEIIPAALSTGKSMIFKGVHSNTSYYASHRVANEILEAQINNKVITVWVQKPEVRQGEESPLKPWQRLSWLATPSRF